MYHGLCLDSIYLTVPSQALTQATLKREEVSKYLFLNSHPPSKHLTCLQYCCFVENKSSNNVM